MKIGNISGEFAFKALGRINDSLPWELSPVYFFNHKEAALWMPLVVWPVEIQDGQIIYVPSQEELE